MTKRFATAAEIHDAPILPLLLPASAHESDTISGGERPELYSAADLKKSAVGKASSLRTSEFEKRLVAIWRYTEKPVPFLFRTGEGRLRSLDAGCLGYLANRPAPDVELQEEDGVVRSVTPTERLLGRLAERAVKVMVEPLPPSPQ